MGQIAKFIICTYSYIILIMSKFHLVSSLFCRIAKIRVKDFCKTFVISCTTSSHVETSLQQHFSGRSHLMMMGKMRTAEKSVYIKGFQSGITGEELKLFLEQEIGGVN